MFSAKPKTPPPDRVLRTANETVPFADRRSAGRYESSQKGCSPSDKSPKRFFSTVCSRQAFAVCLTFLIPSHRMFF